MATRGQNDSKKANCCVHRHLCPKRQFTMGMEKLITSGRNTEDHDMTAHVNSSGCGFRQPAEGKVRRIQTDGWWAPGDTRREIVTGRDP
ncbi:hypothetical protein NQZ68_032332 [Dissostichus eleginoides]|nr:hypothetical protein NQZ68_032332 [Dissostichus eleginoides]